VDDTLLEAMAHPAVCAHLHLPLQSGDDGVLRRMNRRYTVSEFRRAVDLARRRLDRPAVTTDVMVGFPGEDDAAFENTRRTCRRIGFSRVHVFPFSPRPGTPAAEMGDRPEAAAVAERGERLRALGRSMAARWAAGFVGQTVRVLFERRSHAGRLSGYSDRYVPVSAEGGADLIGRTAPVRCAQSFGATLIGSVDRTGSLSR
jgi:threonylcarbamoyladenosine tRNA methylthiotransferase MtaB